jgi:hypothetical protein
MMTTILLLVGVQVTVTAVESGLCIQLLANLLIIGHCNSHYSTTATLATHTTTTILHNKYRFCFLFDITPIR